MTGSVADHRTGAGQLLLDATRRRPAAGRSPGAAGRFRRARTRPVADRGADDGRRLSAAGRARRCIDPLANDTDPDGQGLAVREVGCGSERAASPRRCVDLHLVQCRAHRDRRAAPVLIRLLGVRRRQHQSGQIRVVPVPAPKRIPPPLAAPITATVRAGDAVTIPVSRYATSQDGSPVTAELDPASARRACPGGRSPPATPSAISRRPTRRPAR